jgi:serine/threonine protein kinase
LAPNAAADFSAQRNFSTDACASQGSIKDMIYSCPKDWKTSYIQKYTSKRGSPLPEKTVASFSRQILEGMMFLERKGWPYQVVSTGNVLLSRNQSQCHLCDVESAILGITPRFAHLVKFSFQHVIARLPLLYCVTRRLQVPDGFDAAIIAFGLTVCVITWFCFSLSSYSSCCHF